VPHTFESKNVKAKLSISLNKLVLLTFLVVIAYFGYEKYALHNAEQTQASVFILTPQVNDIYFLDMRLINNILNPRHKYRLAKVVSVSGSNISIVYGRVFYQWQNAVVNSIKYDDLNNNNYFELIPDYIPFSLIK
jgi:hypothetical protein